MLICLDPHLTGPLGIHVLPYSQNDDEQCEGLIIKEIVQNGRIDRDGRFEVGDRIIEVNDQTLLNVNFATAQSLISDALADNQLKLNIVRNSRKKPTQYPMPNCSNQTGATAVSMPGAAQLNHLNERLLGSDVNLMKETPKDKLNEEKFKAFGKTKFSNNQQPVASNHPNISENDSQNHRQNDHNQLSSASSLPDDDSPSSGFFNEATPDDFTNDTFQRNGAFNASNARKLGRKYNIRLVKESKSLGFAITSRDNQVGECQIYIKNIMPVGPARADGNLRAGDRLLEVNGIELTGKSHEEACQVLRDIETGQTVNLVVSRQEANFDRSSNHSSFNRQSDQPANERSGNDRPVNERLANERSLNDRPTNDRPINDRPTDNSTITTPKSKLPRKLPAADRLQDANQLDLSRTREVLSFNIPLNDTGSAGLGLSVKGKQSTSSSTKKRTDLGIFVKSILTGGAAFKDGRLRPNDQLISINGISLLNSSNETATETLRRVLMNNEGVHVASNAINLVVARFTDPLENPTNALLSNALQSANDELYETFGTRLSGVDAFHQRNLSTISTDSVKFNESNYRPEGNFAYSNEQFNGQRANGNYGDQYRGQYGGEKYGEKYGDQYNQRRTNEKPMDLNGDFNELYNLNKRSHIYTNGLMSKGSLSTDSNDFTISTPVKTSMKSDFTGSDNLNELNISKFMNNSSRTDVLIENDDQENADPNAYHRDFYKAATNDAQLDNSLNRSKDSAQMMNLSNVTNQLSLNDEDEGAAGGFNFQRDGFGRQSMSEKRYAQLDAKSTDTFKKAKQRKQLENGATSPLKTNDSFAVSTGNTVVKSLSNYETANLTSGSEQRQSKRSISRFPANCCCFSETQAYSQSSRSSCPIHSSSKGTSPKTELTANVNDSYSFESTSVKSNFPIDQPQGGLLHHFGNQQPTPFTLAAQHANQLNKLSPHQPQSNFGYLSRPMNRSGMSYSPAGYGANGVNGMNGVNGLANNFSNFNGTYGKESSHQMSPQFGQWLGMKKSSSLESLQTLMHEVKKETVNYNAHLPYNTLRRPSKVTRNRNTNESFRTAIDKSYEEYMDNLAMETVNEEFGESGFSPTTPANQLTNQTSLNPAGKSATENGSSQTTNTYGQQSKPSSTSLGTTLSNGANEISDEEIGLIRRRSTGSSKKKSGILRTLFRFGSKKFKDKNKTAANSKLSTPQHIKKELEEEVEKIRARKAALYEQEIIQEYYKRLIDQQKFQQLVNQQAQHQRQQIVNHSASSSTNNTLKRQPMQQQSMQQQSMQPQSMQQQSIQQQIKKQENQNLKCLYMMNGNDHQSAGQQALQSAYLSSLPSNHLQTNRLQSTLPNHGTLNKQQVANFETTNSYFPGYGSIPNSLPGTMTNSIPNSIQNSIPNSISSNHIQSRSILDSGMEIQRPKSSYLPYDNSGLNQNNLVNQSDFYGGYYNELGRKPFTNSLTSKQRPAYMKENSIQQYETAVHSRTQTLGYDRSYDLKEAMQRPGSRVAVDLNDDLNNYVIVVRKNSMRHGEVQT